jgi:hypothetical protein
LRAIEVDGPKKLSIYLMPKASVTMRGLRIPTAKTSPTELPQATQTEMEKAEMLVGGELLVQAGGSTDFSTMEVGMHFATIRNLETQFVLVDKGDLSSVKMMEGRAEFASVATGKSVVVSAGETVKATAGGLGKIEKFDVPAEKARWEKAEEEAGLVPKQKKSWFGCSLIPGD